MIQVEQKYRLIRISVHNNCLDSTDHEPHNNRYVSFNNDTSIHVYSLFPSCFLNTWCITLSHPTENQLTLPIYSTSSQTQPTEKKYHFCIAVWHIYLQHEESGGRTALSAFYKVNDMHLFEPFHEVNSLRHEYTTAPGILVRPFLACSHLALEIRIPFNMENKYYVRLLKFQVPLRRGSITFK